MNEFGNGIESRVDTPKETQDITISPEADSILSVLFKDDYEGVEGNESIVDVREPIDSKQEMADLFSDDFSGNDLKKDESDADEQEKAKIKEDTGWSNEIIDAIGSMEEAGIYKKAGLEEAEVNGKKCLIRDEIDWNQKDEMGRTNKERAEQGLSPITKDEKTVELHHIGQHADSPLAELTPEEHRGKGNDTILHNKTKESEIDRQAFAGERSSYWEARAKAGGIHNE